MKSTAHDSKSYDSPIKTMYRAVCALPLVQRLRPQRRRRQLVAMFVGVLVAFPVVGAALDVSWPLTLLLIPYAAGSVLLAGVTRGLGDRPIASLDERQRHIRLSVFADPYLAGALLGVAAGIVGAVAVRVDTPAMWGLFVLVSGVVFGLPSLVLAWNLPEEVDDGE